MPRPILRTGAARAWHDGVPPVLHNCGPGPIAVYRTGAVGRNWTISWVSILDALRLYRPTKTRVRSELLAAKADLEARAMLRPFRGLAFVGAVDGAGGEGATIETLPWLPTDASIDVHRWLLLAFAHVTPPMLLFTRSPELTYCTDGHTLQLRWFGMKSRP